MNTNTGPNAANDEVESTETQGNDKSKRLEVFAKKFADDIYLKTDKNNRFSMLKSYFSSDTYSAEQKRDVLKFAGESSEFSDLTLEEINFFMVRKHFNKAYIEFNSNCVMFKNKVLKKYDISHNQYLDFGIQSELECLSEEDLKGLLKSSVKMNTFIDKFQEEEDIEIEEKHTDSILPKNFNEKLTEKINLLEDNEKQEVVDTLEYYKNTNVREENFSRNFSEKIEALYRLNIFTKSEVKELIVTFVPSLLLKDAQKITGDNKKTELKNNILSKLNLENASITDDEKNIIYENLGELLIDTQEFLDNNILKFEDLVGDKKILEKAGDEIKDTLIQKENENGVSTLGGFKEALDKNSKITGLENFKKGGYIEYIKKNSEGDELKNYYKIESNPDTVKDGRVLLINRGVNVLGGVDGNTVTSYTELLEGFKTLEENKLFVGFNIYSKEKLNAKINSNGKDKIKEDNDIGDFNTDTQIESNINRRTREINSELSQEEKEEEIKNIEEEENIFNVKLLEKKVNHIDTQGSEYGLDKGTTISFVDDNKNLNTISIIDHDHNSITVDHGNGQKPEQLLFEEFFQAFKRDPKPKRISKMNSGSELMDRLISDSKDIWGNMQLENGKIIQKGKDSQLKETKTDYDLFIGEKDIPGLKCNLIKLHKIEGGRAIVSYGEANYEKAKIADKKEQDENIKKKGAKKLYSIDSKKHEIPVGVLHNYITGSGAIARNFEKESEQSDLPEEVKMKSGLMSKIFQKASIADLISSGKLIIDSIENKLKEGNEEMAAQWADKVPLPEGIKADMKTRIEQAQKKRGDEFFDRLKTVDSSDAIKMIKSIIEDRNSPEAKREACLQFMAKQYGNLYTKNGLFENQGRFLWYTSFGGTIGDKMYREAEAKAKKDGTNFTEHELMISLLGNQCRGRDPKPSRRSKLHKEYKAMMGDGKTDEQAKGAKDAGDKRTFEGRLYDVALDELSSGGHNNAIGAITEIIGKGDDGRMDRLETLPFVMMMSGIAYDFDSDVQQKIRAPLGEGVPMISLGFMSTKGGIDLYNNAVVEISRRLENDNPTKYKGMGKTAENIVLNSKKKTKEPRERMNEALNFYEEYSVILSRVLNMTTSRRTDSEAKYESLLSLESEKEDGNEILTAYYNNYAGTRNAFFDADKADGFMEDAYQSKTGEGSGGITGMAPEEVFKSGFKGKPGQSYALKSAEMLHNEFVDQMEAYTKTEFDGGETDKKSAMKKYIKAYIYGFLYNHEKNIAHNMKSPGFKLIGLTEASQFDGVTASDFTFITPEKKRSKASEELLNECVDNVLNKSKAKTKTESGFNINNVGGFVDGIKNQTNKVIDTNNTSSNDENFDGDL